MVRKKGTNKDGCYNKLFTFELQREYEATVLIITKHDTCDVSSRLDRPLVVGIRGENNSKNY